MKRPEFGGGVSRAERLVDGGCRAGELIRKSSGGAGELSRGYQVLTRVVRLPNIDI